MFRCSAAAKKTGIVPEDTKLSFLGFGTMNGKDGKPFKTREGGVMRLESLIAEIEEEMYKKITDNRTVEEEEAKETATDCRTFRNSIRRSVQSGIQRLYF